MSLVELLLPPPIIAGPAVPALISFGGWLMGSTAGAVIARIAITVAVGLLQANAQKRKMKRALGRTGLDTGRSQMVQDPLAPRRIIYGETLVGGVITFYYSKPSTEGYHYMALTLAAHPIHAITQIRIDNQPVSLDASGFVTSGPHAGNFIQIRKYLGKPEGERDTAWENELGTHWTKDHLGKSIARLHIRLKWDADKFPNGLPPITAIVQGAKLYDPRDQSQNPTNPATWKHTNNAALVAAHFLHTRKHIPYSRIDTPALIAAANVCSELVSKKDGTPELRYRANGLYTHDQNPLETLAELAETMAGGVVDAGGRWTIHAGAWRAPLMELTDADLVGEFRCTPRASSADTYNAVRGSYYSPVNDWAPADFPAIKNDTYKTWDGDRRLYKDVSYPFITSPSQAQRVAKIDLERARSSLVIEADFNARALRLQPADTFTLTRPRLGWQQKTFEVLKWQLKTEAASEASGLDAAAAPTLKVTLTAQETAPAIYNWNGGEETTIDLTPNLGTALTHYVAPVTGLALSQPLAAEETALPRIKATWHQSSDPLVKSGGFTELQVRKEQETIWIHWSRLPGSHTQDFVNDIPVGTLLHLRARHINQAGVRSAWATASITPLATNPTLDLSHWALGRMSNGAFHSQHLVIKAKAGGQPYPGKISVRLQVSPTEFHTHAFHHGSELSFQLHQGWGNVINIEVGLYKPTAPAPNWPTLPPNPVETKLIPVIKDGQDGMNGAPGAPGGGGPFTLTVESNLSILNLGGSGTYPMNTVVQLQAPYQVSYGNTMRYFSGWYVYGGGASNWLSSTSNLITHITMHGNCIVRANY